MKSVSSIFASARSQARTILTEFESRDVLSSYGISSVPGRVCISKDQAVSYARELGYPVVAKVVSNDITHKTEAGGVFLGLTSDADVSTAYDSIRRNASKAKAKLDGVAIEKQRSGVEVLIGVKKDPQFGSVIAFGLGGIFVELFRDVALRVAPLDAPNIKTMIAETRVHKLLQGFRGAPPKDVISVENMLSKVSRLVLDHPEISELDLNPVFVYEKGCEVADARIILEEKG